ncbi:MAG: TIGR02186 family protein [Pseudomonadota bacterium]
MRPASLLLSMLFLLVPLGGLHAQEKLQLGVSVDVVPVEADFAGRNIVIFGAIEGADQPRLFRGEYEVLIEVIGELENAIVRKKDRIGGIWINAAAREYHDVPSFYSVSSGTTLDQVADLSLLSKKGIGIDYLKAKPVELGNVEEFLTEGEFSSALRRTRIENGLFSENPQALEMISPSLFRAAISLPPNVPIGTHTVRAHLFLNGVKLDEVKQSFEVRKVGFEEWVYDLAHEHSFLYGLICVLLAIFTGWFANVVFRKN